MAPIHTNFNSTKVFSLTDPSGTILSLVFSFSFLFSHWLFFFFSPLLLALDPKTFFFGGGMAVVLVFRLNNVWMGKKGF